MAKEHEKPMVKRKSYIAGVRKAEEERKARKERSEKALNDMIDFIKANDIDAAANALETNLKRLNKYQPTPPSAFVKFTPSPKGREPRRRNAEMFAGVGGVYAGSRRARREWERILRKHGYETVQAFMDAHRKETTEAVDDDESK